MSNILDGIIYDAIFPSTLNLTAIDLNYRGMYSAGGGNFPADTTKGYWYLINIQGALPAPCGFCQVGSAIVYSGTQWEKGQVMASGVSVVNGLSGAVILTPDNISDATSSKKFTTSADIIKLSGIESGAQVNLTPAQLKVAYESNADTNALTDIMATKLNSSESNAQENKIEVVKLNGVPLTIDGLKGVDIVIGSVFRFVGTTPTIASLNLIPSPQTGDTWNVVENGINYSWNGTEWSPLGGSIDLTAFYTKSETYSKLEVDTALGNKVDKVIDKQLSTEDYSTVEKAKLAGVEVGAQANTSRVKVSLTDTVEGELEHKIIAGTNITINKVGSGADEQLEISASGGASGVISVNGYTDVVVLTKTDVGLANVTNNQQLPMSYLDTDAILSANSDIRVASQKAVKSYVDGLSAINSHGVINLPTITDNLNGSVTIGTDGVILFYKDALGVTGIVKLSVVNGATLTLTDNAQNYVYCSYNAGVPTYMVTTNQNIFYPNASLTPVIRITREGNELYLNDYANYGLAQSGKILLKDTIENGFRRNSGLDLTTTSTRQIQVSAGACWFGVNPVSVPQSISGDVSTTMYEYYRVGGVWTKSANLSEFDATYYSNGTDRLTLADGNWVSKYIFKNVGTKNEIYYVSGNSYDSKAGAFAENFPTVPSYLLGHSLYVGKIVIQKNQALGTAYGRNYTGYVTTGTLSSHDDFSNIQGTGSGIKAGHISDGTQTIYGDKTFINNTTANESFISSLTGDNIITNTSVKTTLQNIDNTYTISKHSTGFTNNDTINITYDSTARTVTLAGTFEAYWRGKKISSLVTGWVSSAHSTGLTRYYLYYDGASFIWATSLPADSVLRIADVYYGTADKFAVRRTFGFMQPETRKDLHKNIGSYVNSGGTLSNFTLSSTVDTNRRPHIALTEIIDEDLGTLSPAHTSQLYTKMYLTASGTSNFTVETTEIVPLNGNQPYYNQLVTGTWQQTLLPTDNYMALWLVAIPTTADTTSQKYRYVWVQGQSVSSGLSTVQAQTTSSVNLGTLSTITSEYIFVAKMIIRYTTGNWIIVQSDILTGNRFSQTMIVGGSSTGGSVSVDSSISGNGTIESPLSISTHTTNTSNPHSVTKVQVGLGNCDDTSDLNKPISTATQTAIDLKQNSFTGISEKTPILAEDISIETTGRVLTITPPLGYFDFYVDGSGVTKKYTKTGVVNFPAFADITGVWYFYFDNSGNPQVSQTIWSDLSTVCTVYRIYWNATLTGSAKLVVESIEMHLNTISAQDHEWKHKNGTIWMSGFNAIHNRLVTGTPATDGSNTVFALTTGKNMDDNLEYTVTNGSGSAKFEQILGNTSAGTLNATNSALFEIRTNDAGGLLNILPATRFPFPWDSVTNRPEYITTGGVRSLVSNGGFFVTFIYALQEPRNGKAIKIVPAYQEFTTLTNAQAFVWEDLQAVYPTVADNEIRPLYKLIFEYKSAYAVNCKYSVIRQVDDLRKTRVTTNSTAGGAMLATNVIVTPSGTLSSTNAQSALLELDTEKVAKVTALDNAITRFDGTLGDIQSSLATVSDTGSIDIPTGQNFTINAVPLKNVAETLSNKTINSPTITGTPTGITATHVGLGNVTNNAQVKKIASSTDNAIMRFDGETGDLPQNSLATISDTGTVNIPTGQSYNINGVNLKDVSETLTNKTLTSPVLNTEVTGTGITTTGEAGKIVKTSSLGNISMTQSVDGNVGVILNNTSAGVNSNAGFSAKGNTINYFSAWCYGSGRTGTIFGKTMANHSVLLAQGADNAGLLLGTLGVAPLVIGTNGVERINIGSTGTINMYNDIVSTQSIDTTAWVDLTNNSTGVNAVGGFRAKNSDDTRITLTVRGSGNTTSLFSESASNWTVLTSSGTLCNGLMIGNQTAKPVIIGTNNTSRIRVEGDGSKTTFFSNVVINNGTIGSLVGSTVYEDTTKEIYVGDSIRRTALRVNQRPGTFTPFGATNTNSLAGARDFRIYATGLGTGNASTDGSILEYDGVNLNLLPKGYGRVTIGSDIVGNTGMTATLAKLVVSNTASSIILAKAYSATANQGGMLCLGKSRGVASGTETTTLSGDNLGYISFEGVGSGSTPVIGATIEGVQNGTAGASFVPADIVFKTCTGTSQNEVFRLRTDKNAVFSGYMGQYRGADVSSATAITPSGQIFHVTGTTAIATINIPYTGFNGTITIIPDAIFTTTTAGNIGLATTAVVNRALTMTYDNTTAKWYPSY